MKLSLSNIKIYILIFLFSSCKKDYIENPNQEKINEITLEEAKAYFDKNVIPNSKLTLQASIKRSKSISLNEIYKENDLLFKDPI